jgi:predicted secreted protein
LNSELSQEIPSSYPVDQGEGDDWDTVGELTERSRNPAPTVEELVSQMTQWMTRVAEPQVLVEESRPDRSTTTGAEEPVAAQAEEEAPAEAGLVDIASILGAPTVSVVRSSL